MAQRILGLDIGSKNICAAVLESSIRTIELAHIDVEPIVEASYNAPPPVPGSTTGETEKGATESDRKLLRRKAVLKALKKLQERGALEADHVVTALDGDAAFSRVLDFPFNDPKRIKQVLGFELEAAIPFNVEDVIIDHRILKTREDGTTIFAVAAPSEEVEGLLSVLEDAGIDPRIVSLDTFGFTKLVTSALETKSENLSSQGCVAVVDMGHARTDITVMLNGNLAFARTIRRGGQQIARVVSRNLNVPEDQALRTMVAHGRLLKPSEVDHLKKNPSNEQAKNSLRMNDALRQGLGPILRDINQTFRNHEQLHKEPVEKLYLAGGLANLRGIDSVIHETLEVPCHTVAELMDNVTESVWASSDSATYASAVGLALEMARGGSRGSINFRKGPFAFKSDFQYIAERGAQIAALLVLCFAGLFGFYSVQKTNLEAEKERLEANLEVISEQVVGVKIRRASQVEKALKSKPKKSYLRALPQRSAVWVYREVSKAVTVVRQTQMPSAAKVENQEDEDGGAVSLSDYNIEIQDFDLTDSKGLLTGQVNNVDAGELFLAKLKLVECFSDVTFEETDIVSFARHRGWRIFKINFNIDCSKKKKESDSDTKSGEAEASGEPGGEVKPGAVLPVPAGMKDASPSSAPFNGSPQRPGAVLPTPSSPASGGAR